MLKQISYEDARGETVKKVFHNKNVFVVLFEDGTYFSGTVIQRFDDEAELVMDFPFMEQITDTLDLHFCEEILQKMKDAQHA